MHEAIALTDQVIRDENLLSLISGSIRCSSTSTSTPPLSTIPSIPIISSSVISSRPSRLISLIASTLWTVRSVGVVVGIVIRRGGGRCLRVFLKDGTDVVHGDVDSVGYSRNAEYPLQVRNHKVSIEPTFPLPPPRLSCVLGKATNLCTARKHGFTSL